VGCARFRGCPCLADERAARCTQQVAQRPVELRRHSGGGRLGFAQRGDLQEQLARIDLGMIVGQQIERHRGNLRQQSSSSVGASAAAGMSSQCPLQTEASWFDAAEIVKITGFDMFAPLAPAPP
jgi:hypothetical protein